MVGAEPTGSGTEAATRSLIDSGHLGAQVSQRHVNGGTRSAQRLLRVPCVRARPT